ncbi:MAG: ATP-binding protein [Acidobacteriota bacterium]|nr:ATP-binding protein [Acidobacteriota bacterium]
MVPLHRRSFRMLVAGWLAWASVFGWSQNLFETDYAVLHLNREDGLSNTGINVILQDRLGFVWFGTRDGLNRYDGSRTKVYRNVPDDPCSVSNNHILSLYQDDADYLWVGTKGGLNRLDPMTGCFTRYTGETNGFSDDHILAAVFDDAGFLWVATLGGLDRFNPESGEVTGYRRNPEDPDSLGADSVTALFIDTEQQRLWVGYSQGLVSRMDLNRPGVFKHFREEEDRDLGYIESLVTDRLGNLWIGAGAGLSYLKQAEAEAVTIYRNDIGKPIEDVMDISRDEAGNLWVATFSSGLYYLNPVLGKVRHWQFKPDRRINLQPGRMRCVFSGRDGIVWVGYLGDGANCLAPSPFAGGLGAVITGTVKSLMMDDAGAVWIGKESGGLEHWKPGAAKPVVYGGPDQGKGMRANAVYALYQTRDSSIYIGTGAQDIYRLLPDGSLKHYPLRKDPALPVYPIQAFLEDVNGTLWVGSGAVGLHRMDRPGIFERVILDPTSPNAMADRSISFLHGASKPGEPLWIGAQHGVLRRMDLETPGKFKTYRHDPQQPDSLPPNSFFCLWEDRDGTFWIGTDGGLCHLNPNDGKTRIYTSPDGLPGDAVYTILGDHQGRLWLATANGLSLFEPASETFSNFGKDHGLPTDFFSPHAGFVADNKLLAFGGNRGMVIFHPQSVARLNTGPRVLLTEIRLDGKTVNPLLAPKMMGTTPEQLEKLSLRHDHRTLQLQFAALDFHGEGNRHFQYKLEPFDREWQNQTGPGSAIYTNLDPGRYTFMVKAENRDGVSGEETVLQIDMPASPWASWWAYTLYMLSLIGLSARYIHMQRRKLETERALREKEQQMLDQERSVTEHLRRLNRLKDEFLANTSHELRTPLNGIIGLAEALTNGVAGPLNQKAMANLTMITNSGRRLSGLINDILDFSRLRRHKLKLHRRPMDVYDSVSTVLRLVETLAMDKSILLENSVHKDFPAVFADPDRFQQILHNLVGNAVKFTVQGTVRVYAGVENGLAAVSVSDTGPGIPESKLNSIFHSFEQLEESATRSQSGTGLGLAICKQLVALHGGTISVKSRLGVGSTFRFTMPLADEAAEEPKKKQKTPISTRDDSLEPNSDVFPQAEDQGHSAHSGNGYHILVVDDDPVNRRVLHDQLAPFGYRISEAANGFKAVDFLERESADLVFLDIMMPQLSGYQTCRRIRERFAAHELPVIFLSALNQIPDLTAGFEAGGNDYICKPPARSELLARLDLHLRMRQSTRVLEEIMDMLDQGDAVEQVLGRLLTVCLDDIPGAQAGVSFLKKQDGRLQPIAQKGYSEDQSLQPLAPDSTRFYLSSDEADRETGTRMLSRPDITDGEAGEGTPLATLCMPLYLEGRPHGFLVLDNFDSRHAYSLDDIRRLDNYREHAVLALSKARFLGEIEASRESLLEIREQMALNDKMAALGMLTAGIGHEINNPVHYVAGSAENLQAGLKDLKTFLLELAGEDADPEVLTVLEDKMKPLFNQARIVSDGSQRISRIVRDLSVFSRGGSGVLEKVDLHACLISTGNLVTANFKDCVTFSTDFSGSLYVMGHQGKLNQVFMNLAVNACQAIQKHVEGKEEVGRLSIRTEERDGKAVIHFEDTGGGIPEETRRRIFEPFFTTKPSGEGTGLGLSISQGIIQRHGGEMTVTSNAGLGSCFTIRLPSAE